MRSSICVFHAKKRIVSTILIIFLPFLQNQQQQYEVINEAAMQQVVETESYDVGKNAQQIQSKAGQQQTVAKSAEKDPCLNCRLIQMGSAISYGDNSCPQCGEFCG